MKHVTVLAYAKALGTSITLPIEMLNAASSIARLQLPHRNELNVEIASYDGTPLQITGGIEIRPHRRLHEIKATDLIILPAMWGNPQPVIKQHPYIIQWLLEHYANRALICATGTGVCFLAQAGLLDGKPATTHWYYFERFKRIYPQVNLQTKRFITNSGNLYCAGRINSITNLVIHFIERFYDQAVARQIEQHFAHEIKQSYESIFYSFNEQAVHHDEAIIQAQQWLLRNYAHHFKLEDVAQQFDMSLRTFNRRFKQATGGTPLEYLQQIRIGTAKDLLQESNLSVAEVSFRVGFNDASHFAALFKRLVSLNPRDYRRLVRAKLFSVYSD